MRASRKLPPRNSLRSSSSTNPASCRAAGNVNYEVVPAKAGTHTPQPIPAFARTGREDTDYGSRLYGRDDAEAYRLSQHPFLIGEPHVPQRERSAGRYGGR